MENNQFDKYTSEEILQILIDFYNFKTVFDPEVYEGEKLTFQTKIGEWRNICDLLEPNKLAKYYHELLELKTDQKELLDILTKSEYTLKEFCDYIAKNAIKERIDPVVSMGLECQEAAIFKALKEKLEKKGINTEKFKPSTELGSFFEKAAPELLEMVSKIAPGALTNYTYQSNMISRIGGIALLIAIIILIITAFVSKVTWFLLIPFGIAFLLLFIGNKMKPAKYEVGNYKTIRDLIMEIKFRLNH
jgi:hypothetical protein